MGGSELSEYEIERFGEVAGVVRNAVIETVHSAQAAALRVHHEQGHADRDAYSAALRVNLNRGLLAKFRDVTGIQARKPDGQRSRFDLPIVTQTGVALYWWRVPGDVNTHLLDARIRDVSALQQHLMSFAPTEVSRQLTLEHVGMSDEEIEQHYVDAEHFSQQMRMVEGRTVTLWVSASPDALYDFGWGDAELVDARTGELAWPRWESLRSAAKVAPTLYAVDEGASNSRFDADCPSDDGLNLSRRSPEEIVEQPIVLDAKEIGDVAN